MHCAQFRRTVIAILLFLPSSSLAAGLSYSWSGNLELAGADDPWSIDDTTPFSLDVFLASDAGDSLDQDVALASFEVTGASLTVGTDAAQLASEGTLEFEDSVTGGLDIVTFSGNFELLGEAVDLVSAVALPDDTYEFTGAVELPPYFSTTIVELRTGTGIGPYNSAVESGTPVTVVPEPGSIGLATLAFACVAIVHCRRMSPVFRENKSPEKGEAYNETHSSVCVRVTQ